ncbi:MAG: DUF1080 domain-containing protein [Tepidisphaerales bacterium]
MHRIITATTLLLLGSLCGAALAADQPLNTPPEGFVNLFNGKDLSGWRGRQQDYSPYAEAKLTKEELAAKQAAWNADRDKHWSVDTAKGEIVSDGRGVYLTTGKDYGDFELYVDWLMVSRNGDSGIYLRTYPQVQIWDPGNAGEKRNGADKGSGALWNNNNDNPGKWPLVLADNPVGQWNTLRIKMVGSRCWVWLNGKQTVDGQILDNYFDRSKPVLPTGPIELQTHGSEIRFRNVYVREIAPAEGNAALEKLTTGNFASVFNGQDFTGWDGPIAEYQVKDGAITCRPNKGGTIFTKEEYGDFEARLEFKLPPAGNNGLAIRYPGKGDTAYVGMCELQILDDTADEYKKLDPRQYCCSIYGVVPAHRGYLRPVGEWNFEHVTIKGSTIRVELNGTVVINADVSTVKEYMANSKHPGITRTKGSFGFAGHNDPVQFRNIWIKKLD